MWSFNEHQPDTKGSPLSKSSANINIFDFEIVLRFHHDHIIFVSPFVSFFFLTSHLASMFPFFACVLLFCFLSLSTSINKKAMI